MSRLHPLKESPTLFHWLGIDRGKRRPCNRTVVFLVKRERGKGAGGARGRGKGGWEIGLSNFSQHERVELLKYLAEPPSNSSFATPMPSGCSMGLRGLLTTYSTYRVAQICLWNSARWEMFWFCCAGEDTYPCIGEQDEFQLRRRLEILPYHSAEGEEGAEDQFGLKIVSKLGLRCFDHQCRESGDGWMAGTSPWPRAEDLGRHVRRSLQNARLTVAARQVTGGHACGDGEVGRADDYCIVVVSLIGRDWWACMSCLHQPSQDQCQTGCGLEGRSMFQGVYGIPLARPIDAKLRRHHWRAASSGDPEGAAGKEESLRGKWEAKQGHLLGHRPFPNIYVNLRLLVRPKEPKKTSRIIWRSSRNSRNSLPSSRRP
ncbi:hypothetical protein KC358_g78 [Hortaea werneckii]|nr:hypothetical protein KC358_g78 [Hortaea werneckii]